MEGPRKNQTQVSHVFSLVWNLDLRTGHESRKGTTAGKGENSGREGGNKRAMRGGEHNQNILYTCLKMS
jgi:hypothetical protein